MKALALVVALACAPVLAQPVVLLPGADCPTARPALFLPEPVALEAARRLASAEAERDALKASHIDGRKVALAVVSAALAGAAVSAAVVVGIHESQRAR